MQVLQGGKDFCHLGSLPTVGRSTVTADQKEIERPRRHFPTSGVEPFFGVLARQHHVAHALAKSPGRGQGRRPSGDQLEQEDSVAEDVDSVRQLSIPEVVFRKISSCPLKVKPFYVHGVKKSTVHRLSWPLRQQNFSKSRTSNQIVSRQHGGSLMVGQGISKNLRQARKRDWR